MDSSRSPGNLSIKKKINKWTPKACLVQFWLEGHFILYIIEWSLLNLFASSRRSVNWGTARKYGVRKNRGEARRKEQASSRTKSLSPFFALPCFSAEPQLTDCETASEVKSYNSCDLCKVDNFRIRTLSFVRMVSVLKKFYCTCMK